MRELAKPRRSALPAPAERAEQSALDFLRDLRPERRAPAGAVSVNRLTMTAWAVGPVNGGSPASISYSTQPRLYCRSGRRARFARGLLGAHVRGRADRSCPSGSGALPAVALTALAMPKSITIASPSWSITFSGLMSRWTTPCGGRSRARRRRRARFAAPRRPAAAPRGQPLPEDSPATNGMT